jgi:hypothetical protein
VVVDWILTNPYFYFSILIFAEHVLCDLDWPVDANEFPETMQREYHLLSIPILEVQETISVNQHLSEFLLVIVDGLALRTCGMEIEESANVWLVVIHSG